MWELAINEVKCYFFAFSHAQPRRKSPHPMIDEFFLFFMKLLYPVRNHSFNSHAKFSKKLTFLTTCYAYVRVRMWGSKLLVFRNKFAYIRNEWSLTWLNFLLMFILWNLFRILKTVILPKLTCKNLLVKIKFNPLTPSVHWKVIHS